MSVKVSIIIPVYNVEKYLERCMKSVVNQTLKDIEIILVDDESPDSSSRMCDFYAKQDSRIKVIHKKNGGLGFARNSGIEIATGEYIAYLDSDDFIDSNMYETLYYRAKAHNADTCFCGYNKFLRNNRVMNIAEFQEEKIYGGSAIIEEFLPKMIGSTPRFEKDFEMSMCVWRAIYSRKIIKENDIRFCSEREFISEDVIYHIDYLTCATNVLCIPHQFYYYCQNSDSLTGKYRSDRFEKDVDLYCELQRKLTKLNLTDKYFIRLDRMLIGRARTAMFQEVKSNNIKKEKIINIKNICKNKTLTSVLKKYPYLSLPKKYGFMALLMRYKMTNCIFIGSILFK